MLVAVVAAAAAVVVVVLINIFTNILENSGGYIIISAQVPE